MRVLLGYLIYCLIFLVIALVYAFICFYINRKLVKTLPYLGVITVFWLLLPWEGKYSRIEYENVYGWFLIIRDIIYVIVSVGMLVLAMKMTEKKHLIIRILYCGSVFAVNLYCAQGGRIHWIGV